MQTEREWRVESGERTRPVCWKGGEDSRKKVEALDIRGGERRERVLSWDDEQSEDLEGTRAKRVQGRGVWLC